MGAVALVAGALVVGFAEVLDAVLDAVENAVENAVAVDIVEYVDWLAGHEVGLADCDVAGFVAVVHAVVGFVDVDDVVEFVDDDIDFAVDLDIDFAVVGFVDVVHVEFAGVDVDFDVVRVEFAGFDVDFDVGLDVVDGGSDKVAVVVHAEMLLWRNLEMDREP